MCLSWAGLYGRTTVGPFVLVGGNSNNASNAGVSALNVNNALTNSNWNNGSRLALVSSYHSPCMTSPLGGTVKPKDPFGSMLRRTGICTKVEL